MINGWLLISLVANVLTLCFLTATIVLQVRTERTLRRIRKGGR